MVGMLDDFKKIPRRKQVKLDTLGYPAPGSDPKPAFEPDPHVINQIPDNEPEFRTPEEVSKFDKTQAFLPPLEQIPEIEAHASDPQKKGFRRFLRVPDLTKKQWIIVGVALLILLCGGTTFALTHKSSPPPKKTAAKVAAKPAPKPILSPLTGMPVTIDQQNYPVTGVMIENSPDARPQSGLDQAGVVFEAIAEAGITRFLALYQESSPGVLGPVRSSRPYYLDWAMAFDASYAHVGGSPDALQRIKDIGVKDLDQFFNPGPYHRSSARFAPHNMYSSVEALRNLGISKGWTKSSFSPFVRKAKEEPSKAPTAKTLDFGISGPTYNVHYDYDPASNTYKRSEGGAAHVDNETKAQLSPKVVIALAMPYSLMADGYHSDYQTTGSGNMLLFQDGIFEQGTWSKAGPKEQFVFKDGQGHDMKLNPGQTWISVVDDITKATYQP
jgi:hypothetical protein